LVEKFDLLLIDIGIESGLFAELCVACKYCSVLLKLLDLYFYLIAVSYLSVTALHK